MSRPAQERLPDQIEKALVRLGGKWCDERCPAAPGDCLMCDLRRAILSSLAHAKGEALLSCGRIVKGREYLNLAKTLRVL